MHGRARKDYLPEQAIGMLREAQVRISLGRSQIEVGDKVVNLPLGMAVTVGSMTGERIIIGYLLSPLSRHGQERMREL